MLDFNLGTLKLLGIGVTGYTLQSPIEGLDAPDYRVTEYDRPGTDGIVIPTGYYGGRTITLKGIVRGQTPAIYEANRQALGRAMALRRDSYNVPMPIRLDFTKLSGAHYFVDVIPRQPIYKDENVNWANYMLTLTATYHLISGFDEVVSGNIMPPSGGGFLVPTNIPTVSDISTGGSVIVSNNGTEGVQPRIELYGPLTNPYILNATNGKYIQLNTTIPAGSKMVIDTSRPTVKLDGSGNFLPNVVRGSSYWKVEVGNNTINLSTSKTSDTGRAVVRFYPGFVGI